MGFAGLGLRTETLEALDRLGYEEPTPIQVAAIPLLMAGHDLVGQAATGTGKTAAFALPMLERFDADAGRGDGPFALVLVPTRELAVQVSEAISNYGRALGVRVVTVYGGQPIVGQLRQLSRGAHVVVATPGRMIDHLKRRSVSFDDIEMVVLDEADEMLDMGFAEDIETILEATPTERQTVLFSATMPGRINAIAERHQRDPERVRIGGGDKVEGTVLVTQRAHVVERRYKAATLGRILDVEAPGAALVFCRTRGDVDALTETMNGRGHRAEALHGGMDQSQRERVIGRLRDGAAQLLVATDVAARGLDIDTLTHVVNHDVPAAPESYVHRIGRVGRAGREGVAITLAEPKELRLLANIERLTKQSIERVPVPGVADLHTARRARTVEAIRAVLDAGDTEPYDDVVDALSPEHDLRAIALAAVALAHDTIHARIDETEIPDASRSERSGRKGSKDSKDSKGYKDKGGKGSRGDKADKGARGGKGGGSKGSPKPGDGGPTGYLFVALGKRAGVRPADLVGAIANESGVSGRDIGPIKIGENHSVVGVPEGSVDTILSSMRTTSIRGKKTKVRRYQE